MGIEYVKMNEQFKKKTLKVNIVNADEDKKSSKKTKKK